MARGGGEGSIEIKLGSAHVPGEGVGEGEVCEYVGRVRREFEGLFESREGGGIGFTLLRARASFGEFEVNCTEVTQYFDFGAMCLQGLLEIVVRHAELAHSKGNHSPCIEPGTGFFEGGVTGVE